MTSRTALRMSSVLIFVAVLSPQMLLAKPLESKRMERAKDLIADEQWGRAIDELKAAAADQKEPNKDEALFWLAHSSQSDELRTCLRDLDHGRTGLGASRLHQHEQRASRGGQVAAFERDLPQHRNHFRRIRVNEAAKRLDAQVRIGQVAFRHPCGRR